MKKPFQFSPSLIALQYIHIKVKKKQDKSNKFEDLLKFRRAIWSQIIYIIYICKLVITTEHSINYLVLIIRTKISKIKFPTTSLHNMPKINNFSVITLGQILVPGHTRHENSFCYVHKSWLSLTSYHIISDLLSYHLHRILWLFWVFNMSILFHLYYYLSYHLYLFSGYAVLG